MEVESKRLCSYCKDEKFWIWEGQKLKDGSKIYVDQSASRWAGKRCPDCEKRRVHAAVKFDLFERNLVLLELEKSGFHILSRNIPFQVEKDGKSYSVGIKHAYTKDGQLILAKDLFPENYDFYALIFQSVRLCTAEQMEKIRPNIALYQSKPVDQDRIPS